MTAKQFVVLTVFGVALLIAAPANASQITAYVYNQQGCACEDYAHVYGASGALSVSLTNIHTGASTPFGTLDTTASASATAWYGGVRVGESQYSTSTTVGLPAASYFDSMTATGSFDDVIRIAGPAGQSGLMDVLFHLSGSGSTTAFGGSGSAMDVELSAYISIGFSGAGVNNSAHSVQYVPLSYAHGGVGSFTLVGPGHVVVPILFNQDITIGMVASCSSDTRFRAGSGTTTGACDLNHTVQWDGLAGVFDSSGAAITPSVASESGVDYRNALAGPADTTAVPEPGTLLLLATGLLGAARYGRRVSQRPRQ